MGKEGENLQEPGINTQALAGKLVWSFHAGKDIDQGQKMAEILKGTDDEPYLLLAVSDGLRIIGKDASPLIKEVETIANEIDSIPHQQHINGGLSTWYAGRGDFEKATEYLQKANRPRWYTHITTYLELARLAVSFKKDPTPFIAEARKTAGYFPVGDKRTTRIDYDKAYMEVSDLGKIAQTLFLLKLDYSPLLEELWGKAHEKIRGFSFHKAIGTFVFCGDFQKAKQLLDMIQPSDSPHHATHELEQAQEILVSELLRQGNLETAVAIAQQTQNPLFIAETYAHKAVEEARNGIDPKESLQHADIYAKEYEGQPDKDIRNRQTNLTRTIALMGLVNALLGKERVAQTFFAVASHYALGTPLPPRPEDFIYLLQLTEIVSQTNLSPDLIFQQALRLNESIEQDDYLGKAEFEMNWEDIIASAIENGALAFARNALSSFPELPLYQEKKAEWLTRLWISLGIAESKKGLSKKEREKISPEDIQTILLGNNDEAKRSIAYFGLDKKL